MCNGGHVGGRFWFKGPTPDGCEADAGVHHVGGLREERRFSLVWARDCYEAGMPRGLIWIMDDPFGNAICLGVGGKYHGKVFFWDHEQEPDADEWNGEVETAGNVQLLSDSFSDFVAGLTATAGEDEPVAVGWYPDTMRVSIIPEGPAFDRPHLLLEQSLPEGVQGWTMKRLRLPLDWKTAGASIHKG
ncbi:MAG TPA: SMI1/KNR4 family protein [Phycisphaerae bacterium]|nr:SMI1/KNR4 family protein [Phycisphaerae bacterium]